MFFIFIEGAQVEVGVSAQTKTAQNLPNYTCGSTCNITRKRDMNNGRQGEVGLGRVNQGDTKHVGGVSKGDAMVGGETRGVTPTRDAKPGEDVDTRQGHSQRRGMN